MRRAKRTEPSDGPQMALGRVHGIYNLAALLTMLGALAGCFAISLSISGLLGFALIALMLAGLADLFDGVVARSLVLDDFQKSYGIQLDTVVDVLSFITAPAVIGLSLAAGNPVAVAGIVLYVLAGLVRLAHFNTAAVTGESSSDAHIGLPVTYAALVLPVALLPMALLDAPSFKTALGAIFLAMAAMFVAPVTVPKPRGAFYLIFPALSLGLIAFWFSHPAGIEWRPR